MTSFDVDLLVGNNDGDNGDVDNMDGYNAGVVVGIEFPDWYDLLSVSLSLLVVLGLAGVSLVDIFGCMVVVHYHFC